MRAGSNQTKSPLPKKVIARVTATPTSAQTTARRSSGAILDVRSTSVTVLTGRPDPGRRGSRPQLRLDAFDGRKQQVVLLVHVEVGVVLELRQRREERRV